MKKCEECEYFHGYDYEDCTPRCAHESGFEDCPYNDYTGVKNNGINISIDTQFMSEYIKHTLMNTIQSEANEIACKEIKNIITEDIKESIKAQMEESIKKCVDEEVSEFMQKKIVIGGGWGEEARSLTHQQYLVELIEKELNKRFDGSGIKQIAENEARSVIDNFCRKTKDSINYNIKQMFNDATRQTLTDNVVNMLMCNETYKRLSDSMGKLLP